MIGYCINCRESFFYKKNARFVRCPFCGSRAIKKNWANYKI
jgi:hypothetical protein